jgi:excisionase family DNA binding protein
MLQAPGQLPNQLLTIREACTFLRCARSTFYLILDAGQLGYVRIRKRRMIPYAELKAYLDKNTVRGANNSLALN